MRIFMHENRRISPAFGMQELNVHIEGESCLVSVCQALYSGGYGGGVPPLPIPNREVKPACADGTAMQCGRVGGCRFSSMRVRSCSERSGTALFFVGVVGVGGEIRVIGIISAVPDSLDSPGVDAKNSE